MNFLNFGKTKDKRVYLDYAAASPLLPEAKAAMQPYLDTEFGNPSAVHKEGQRARQAVETAREQVAKTLHVKPESILFTGSGTESNNLAIIGSLRALASAGVSYADMEVITTAIEHPSVTQVMEELRSWGVVVHEVPVRESGVIDNEAFAALLNERTRLVTVGYVNSEIGTIQPLHKLARIIREAERTYTSRIIFHADGAQAPLWLPCQPERLGVDLLSLDAGKCCGPKGVGILINRKVTVTSVLHGGGQEAGCRPGTENVAGIVGAATALACAQADYQARADAVQTVRDKFIAQLAEELPEAVVNGAVGEQRVANNINISLPGVDTEFAVVVLDKHGIAASTKSACSGAGGGESGVVLAISDDVARAASTLRFTLGPNTTIQDVEKVIPVLKTYIQSQSTYR